MNQLVPIEWPPPYKLKRHRRAKRVKLHASAAYGLEITLPTRFSLKHLPDVLEEHKQWILKQIGNRQAVSVLPSCLEFHSINQCWLIEYVEGTTSTKLKKLSEKIIVSGDVHNKPLVSKKILTWIKKEATIFLEERLQYLSEKIGLSYQTLRIRNQKTLWGSCTINKVISLNFKLIFLPLELVDYIIIHELCHTKFLNHSSLFWNLVEKHDTNWREHRRRMRKADDFIPLGLF